MPTAVVSATCERPHSESHILRGVLFLPPHVLSSILHPPTLLPPTNQYIHKALFAFLFFLPVRYENCVFLSIIYQPQTVDGLDNSEYRPRCVGWVAAKNVLYTYMLEKLKTKSYLLIIPTTANKNFHPLMPHGKCFQPSERRFFFLFILLTQL